MVSLPNYDDFSAIALANLGVGAMIVALALFGMCFRTTRRRRATTRKHFHNLPLAAQIYYLLARIDIAWYFAVRVMNSMMFGASGLETKTRLWQSKCLYSWTPLWMSAKKRKNTLTMTKGSSISSTSKDPVLDLSVRWQSLLPWMTKARGSLTPMYLRVSWICDHILLTFVWPDESYAPPELSSLPQGFTKGWRCQIPSLKMGPTNSSRRRCGEKRNLRDVWHIKPRTQPWGKDEKR